MFTASPLLGTPMDKHAGETKSWFMLDVVQTAGARYGTNNTAQSGLKSKPLPNYSKIVLNRINVCQSHEIV